MDEACQGTDWTPLSKDTSFYLRKNGVKTKVKVPYSQTQLNVKKNNMVSSNPLLALELYGKPLNLKIEKFMDRACHRVAAASFIQKFYRGYVVRREVFQ